MKKIIYLTILLFISINFSIGQVYQLPNKGFELWDGNNSDDEPTYWNGFPSAACDLTGVYAVGCNAATTTRHAKTTDIRPGSTGSYSCRIFATQISILGTTIIANGALTTGQIRVGSTSAASEQNYNITHTAQQNFCQVFAAKPDSISFWARFICPSASQEAKMLATIHDNYDYREPEGSDANAATHVVGKALHYFSRGNQNWKKYTIPFDYNYPASNSDYILITFTTNKDAGVGSASDMLFIDDIEMIYNPRLSQLQVNGVDVEGFNPDIHDYYVSVPCQSVPIVSVSTASPNASAQITQATPGVDTAVVVVTAGNITRQYNIYFLHQAITYINADICQGEQYADNWFNLPSQTVAGTFIHNFTTYTSPDCDSIISLTINVHPTYVADTFNVMICENSNYNFYGQFLTEPGIYDTIIPTVFGCDSLVFLNLSIGNFYLLTFDASICNGETYTQNGFNQSVAGTDTLHFVAVNGCDSFAVLNLTVNPSHHNIIYDTIFQDEIYNNYGFLISSTATLGTIEEEHVLSNIYGCDSIVTLRLTIISEEFSDNEDNNFTLNIYPNPVTETLHVEIQSVTFAVYILQLFDTFGRMRFFQEIFSQTAMIDLIDLSKGFYVVRVISSGNVCKYDKLIKY